MSDSGERRCFPLLHSGMSTTAYLKSVDSITHFATYAWDRMFRMVSVAVYSRHFTLCMSS
jgi:hypothetical protein